MGDPPSEAGAVQLTVACSGPPTAETAVGAPGLTATVPSGATWTGTTDCSTPPLPSCGPAPQHAAMPSDVHAHACPRPAAEIPTIVFPASGVPAVVTATGTFEKESVSLPSWFEPQHAAAPTVVTAHVRAWPLEICAIDFPASGVPAVTTPTGRAESACVSSPELTAEVPTPTGGLAFRGQHARVCVPDIHRDDRLPGKRCPHGGHRDGLRLRRSAVPGDEGTVPESAEPR